MKILEQLKEYWFLIIFVIGAATGLSSLLAAQYVSGIALATVKGDAAKLYVQGIIADELAKAGTPSDATIATVNGKLQTHDAKIDGNTSNIALTQQQLADVANILMNPQPISQ